MSKKSSIRAYAGWMILSAAASVAFGAGCSKDKSAGQASGNLVDPVLVCDPFGTGNSGQGVIGSVYRFDNDTMLAYQSDLDGLESHSTAVNATLVASQVNVPTQNFENGFATVNGGVLKDPTSGQTLVDHFGLSLRGEIRLNSAAEDGLYQFALLADDGAVLRIDSNADGAFEQIIDDSGSHRNKLVVSDKNALIPLAHGTALPIRLKYFQGVPHRLGLVLLWRKVAAAPAADEPEADGNWRDDDYFFDASANPKQPYLDLKARGWTEVPAANLYLPASESNPCQ